MKGDKIDFVIQLVLAGLALMSFLMPFLFFLTILFGAWQVFSAVINLIRTPDFNTRYIVGHMLYLMSTAGYLTILFSGGFQGHVGAAFLLPIALGIYYLVLSYKRGYCYDQIERVHPQLTEF